METVNFPSWSNGNFIANLEQSGFIEQCVYTFSKDQMLVLADQVAEFLIVALYGVPTTNIWDKSEAAKLIEIIETSMYMQKVGTFLIRNTPIDSWLPATPHSQDMSIPPAKQSFVSEYFAAALAHACGYQLWAKDFLYSGAIFQPLTTRIGQEDHISSRGSLEMGIHIDVSGDPPGFFTLSCERPASEGGMTYYVDSVKAVNTLLPETISILSQPLYSFDRMPTVFSNAEEEAKKFIRPILEFDKLGNISLVRILSRKNSIIPQTEVAQTAYKEFRMAISNAKKNEVWWRRGDVVASNNHLWCHARTGFQTEPSNDPQGRWITKVYSDRPTVH